MAHAIRLKQDSIAKNVQTQGQSAEAVSIRGTAHLISSHSATLCYL